MATASVSSRAGRSAAAKWPWGRMVRLSLLLAVLVVAVIFPLVFTNGLVTEIAVYTLIYVGAAAAWNIFSGYTGYISLGHAVFFGAGAYTAGVAAQDWNITGDAIFALLPLAGLVAAIIAVPFGLVALRVKRHTFVVITIAVFFIFQLMASNLTVTGGTIGIPAPFLTWAVETYNNPFYYAGLILAGGTTLLSWLIFGSRFGLQLRAIRDDEDRARGLGVRAMRVKLAAFVISAVITGMLGALWFFFLGQVLPQYGFDPLLDLSIALMTFFGGLGTVAGPVVGALILKPGQEYLFLQSSSPYLSEIILGAVFLLVILFMPRGLVPTVGEQITRWRAHRARRRSQVIDGGTGGGADGGPPAAAAAEPGTAAVGAPGTPAGPGSGRAR
jgi:branched-chain amino acid transport system permease protein